MRPQSDLALNGSAFRYAQTLLSSRSPSLNLVRVDLTSNAEPCECLNECGCCSGGTRWGGSGLFGLFLRAGTRLPFLLEFRANSTMPLVIQIRAARVALLFQSFRLGLYYIFHAGYHSPHQVAKSALIQPVGDVLGRWFGDLAPHCKYITSA